MDVIGVSAVSGIPDNYIFESINPPFIDLCLNGSVAAHIRCVNAMKKFMLRMKIPFHDQYCGGKFMDYLLQCENLPDGHLEKLDAIRVIEDMVLYHNGAVSVNNYSAIGGYIPPLATRNPDLDGGGDPLQQVTSLVKTIVVSTTDVRPEAVVVDVCGGNGNLVALIDYDADLYLNIDRNVSNKVYLFEKVVTSMKPVNVASVKLMLNDINTHFDILMSDYERDRLVFYSFHSVYFLSDHVFSSLCGLGFSGSCLVSDLLFAESDHIDGEGYHLELSTNKPYVITGRISDYKITNEKPVFVDDFRDKNVPVYPVRFLVPPVRPDVVAVNEIIANTVMFGPQFGVSGNFSLDFQSGNVVSLVACKSYSEFRRPKVYDLVEEDFYWYLKIGFYISRKLDGVLAFLYCRDGSWNLTLRNGFSYKPMCGDVPALFGDPTKTVVVEVLAINDGKTNEVALFFIDYVPRVYERKHARKYWKDRLSSFGSKQIMARRVNTGLFFKQYLWVPPGSEGLLELKEIRNDGLMFHCPFGSYVSFWKPFKTLDLLVVDTLQKGRYVTYNADKVTYDVLDPNNLFIQPGCYECVWGGNKFHIIAARLDKNELGNPDDSLENGLLVPMGGSINLSPRLSVSFKDLTVDQFLDSHGASMSRVLSNIHLAVLDDNELRVVFGSVCDKLPLRTLGLQVTSEELCIAIEKVTHVDYTRVWNSFFRAGYVSNGPFKPVIKSVNGVWRSVVTVNDDKR